MTLALHGKSRRRKAALALLGVLAVAMAVVAAGFARMYAQLAEATEYQSGAATLKTAHKNSTNPGFQTDDCPTIPGNTNQYGWHFVFQGNNTLFDTLTVTFASAGTIGPDAVDLTLPIIYDPTKKHAYVWTPGPDTLLDASATTQYTGDPDTEFNLSHVCTPGATTGDILVHKVVTNGPADTTQFDFSVAPDGANFSINESQFHEENTAAGSQTVTETAETGYKTLGWAVLTSSTASCPADMPAQQGGVVASFGTDNTAELNVPAAGARIVNRSRSRCRRAS